MQGAHGEGQGVADVGSAFRRRRRSQTADVLRRAGGAGCC